MILDRFVHYKRFGRLKTFFDREALPMRPLETLPRVIHLYWDQGFADAPQIVRLCEASWRERNPGWEVRRWEHADADGVVPWTSLPRGMKITPYSDILRTELLLRFGGVWADATILCTRPLDDWLPQVMAQTDFFAFSRPGRDREIASWFLAARPGSTLVRMLSEEVGAFWKRQSKPTRVYHWFQYIFEYLDRKSRKFRREWRTAPRLAAEPMFALQYDLLAGHAPKAEQIVLYRAMPMQKLTHKLELDLPELRRVVGLLDHRH